MAILGNCNGSGQVKVGTKACMKQQHWNTLASTFAKITDRLGTKIDPGILETVIALNTLGIDTAASCEEHPTHQQLLS